MLEIDEIGNKGNIYDSWSKLHIWIHVLNRFCDVFEINTELILFCHDWSEGMLRKEQHSQAQYKPCLAQPSYNTAEKC